MPSVSALFCQISNSRFWAATTVGVQGVTRASKRSRSVLKLSGRHDALNSPSGSSSVDRVEVAGQDHLLRLRETDVLLEQRRVHH